MKKSTEFNWLGYCTSCNIECCHNTDKDIPENKCTKPGVEIMDVHSYDHRPLECRLFPFDVKEVDEKLTWIMWNKCHVTPKLDYESFMNFFERQFSKKVSLEHIKQYVEHTKINNPRKYSTNNYTIIREVNWRS